MVKWRKRASAEDLKTALRAPHSTTLTEAEEVMMVVAFRRRTLLENGIRFLQEVLRRRLQEGWRGL